MRPILTTSENGSMSLWGKVGYYAVVACTLPCLLLAIPVGLFEILFLETGGEVALCLAWPFLWAYDRI